MDRDFWINLPVQDVEKSAAFFAALGFKCNPDFSKHSEFACVLVGTKKVAVMLFRNDLFARDVQNGLPDTAKTTEVNMSFDALSKQEVNDMADKVRTAGGKIFSEPAPILERMYGCAFTDLDGHRWNILYRGEQ